MKNANGDGTVIKLSGKRRKPYAAVITVECIQYFDDVTKEPSGRDKQKRKYIGYYTTRPQAQSALIEYRKKHPAYTDEPSNEEPSQIKEKQPVFVPTFEQMCKIVIKNKGVQWSKSSIGNFTFAVSKCESINNKRMDEITYTDVQQIMNRYMKEKKSKGILALFKVYMGLPFREAMKYGYIPNSPVQFVTYKATKEQVHKNEIPKEIVLNIINSNCKTRDMLLILLYSGMRINELLDAKIENVDLDHNYLIAGEKTDAGKNRIIPIHPYIRDMLLKFIKTNKMNDANFRYYMKQDVETYGMYFTAHYCRHTFITWGKRYKLDETYVKKIVGHSTQDVTESIYTHALPEDLYNEIIKIPYPEDL
ncbi:MAG: site-specific integrase [Prevotella sp.]